MRSLACVCLLWMVPAAAAQDAWEEPVYAIMIRDQGTIIATYHLHFHKDPTERDIASATKLMEAMMAVEGKKPKIIFGPSVSGESNCRDMLVFTADAEFQGVVFGGCDPDTPTYDIRSWCKVPQVRMEYIRALNAYLWAHDPKSRRNGSRLVIGCEEQNDPTHIPLCVEWEYPGRLKLHTN